MVASVSNLFFRHPELSARRLPPRNTVKLETRHWETCVAIKKEALIKKQPYVLPKRFHVTMTATAAAGAAPNGETIRAWLPVPRCYPFQTDFDLLSANSLVKRVNGEFSSARAGVP